MCESSVTEDLGVGALGPTGELSDRSAFSPCGIVLGVRTSLLSPAVRLAGLSRYAMPFRLFFLPVLLASVSLAQQPAAQEHAMAGMQQSHTHDGFMQGGMHHAMAKGVTLDANTDANTHTIPLRLGPM